MAKRLNQHILALDIGGTKIGAGLVDQFGKIISLEKVTTPKNTNYPKFKKYLFKIIDSFKEDGIVKIGIGLAGQINWPENKIINAPNLKFLNNKNLKNDLFKKFKMPVTIDNDAHCFILGESVFGSAKNFNYAVGITLGTGIGGGIILNQKLIRGQNNTAGEFGHMKIMDGGLSCSCGQMGHFESYASGQAMTNIFKQITGQTKDTFEIEKLYYKKDPAAQKTFDLMSRYLAVGLANIVNTLNPEVIILGGGLIRVKPIIKVALQKYLPQKLFYKNLNKTKITVSQINEKSMILGAALITTKEY